MYLKEREREKGRGFSTRGWWMVDGVTRGRFDWLLFFYIGVQFGVVREANEGVFYVICGDGLRIRKRSITSI